MSRKRILNEEKHELFQFKRLAEAYRIINRLMNRKY